jgi:hypothetical protein
MGTKYFVGQVAALNITKERKMRKQITILKILTTLTAIALTLQVVELFIL